MSAVLTGGDPIAAGVGGLAGGAIASADVGGAGSVADQTLPGVASGVVKDLIATGGDNIENVLVGGLASAGGKLANETIGSAIQDAVDAATDGNESTDETSNIIDKVIDTLVGGTVSSIISQELSDTQGGAGAMAQRPASAGAQSAQSSQSADRGAASNSANAMTDTSSRGASRRRFVPQADYGRGNERRFGSAIDLASGGEQNKEDTELILEAMQDPEFLALSPEQQAEYLAQLKKQRRRA